MADTHRKMLQAKGWKRTTIAMFGVPEEGWISPFSGRALSFKSAILSQKRQRVKSAKK
jgi:hypothetical protein